MSLLMPYFKGFQLLDMSDDGEFAVGFFVFDINGRVFDAPMFLIKGQLKGKELLFLRDRQAFVPSRGGLCSTSLVCRIKQLGRLVRGAMLCDQDRQTSSYSPDPTNS